MKKIKYVEFIIFFVREGTRIISKSCFVSYFCIIILPIVVQMFCLYITEVVRGIKLQMKKTLTVPKKQRLTNGAKLFILKKNTVVLVFCN